MTLTIESGNIDWLFDDLRNYYLILGCGWIRNTEVLMDPMQTTWCLGHAVKQYGVYLLEPGLSS